MQFCRTFCSAFCCAAFALSGSLFGASHSLISTSPELTELIFQLGKGSDVRATPQFSMRPPEAHKLPELGPLYTPSLELTVRLAPEWVVIDQTNLNASYQAMLGSLGQHSLLLDLSRVENVFSESERFLRTVYGESDSPVLDRYRRCWAALPPAPRARHFLAFVWLSPPIMVGHGTFVSDLLERVGGSNALPAYLKLPYPQVSEDWLAGRAPETVFILSNLGTPEDEARALFRKWWPGWNGKVKRVDGDVFSTANLTPLRNLSQLLDVPLPKECRDLP